MKKRLLAAAFALLFTACFSLKLTAQNIIINGNVTAATGDLLAGVSVLIKGSSLGITTDAKGAYSISLPSLNSTLVFSAIGFVSQEQAAGKKSRIDVVLLEDTKILNEVVVTALGIKREEKSLGFAAQTINENAVKDAKSNNWVNALSGKVAGLNIQGAGAGPMGSARITLRGESSLNLDNNQALIVVDGVPVSSRITGTGFSSHLSADSPVDYGSSLSDINPDDIEKVTVLKGPGATALYGSRAAGGAIIITTKSGVRKDRGIGVTVNSNFSVDQINRYPDYQLEYGEGRTSNYYSYLDSADGPNTGTTVAAGRAWGPKFNGQSYFQYNPGSPDGKPTERTPWVAQKDYISGFFQRGTTFSNSVSLEGGTENSSARLSVTHLKNKWIIPNTGFERLNVALSVSQKVSDRLKINGKVNYSNKKSDNLPMAGYNNQSLMYFLILGTTPNLKPEWFKPYWEPGLENIKQRNPFNPTPDNPYLGMYEMLNKMNKHGVIGNISASYRLSDKLDFQVRTGLDMAYEFRSQQRPFSMTRYPRGMYREQNVFSYESNTDFLLNYKDKISGIIDVTASVGANAMRQSYDFAGIYADQLAQPGIYQISNSLDQAVADPLKTKKAINSMYAATQFSYDEKIFLDVTGRNDWSSTLPYGNNSFFYPSVSSSFLINEIFNLPKAVSFAKVRASWAQVGNDTRPYQTARYYDRIYGNSFTNSSTLFNADLKPEITASYEFGLDVRLFKNLIGVDFAYYNNKSRNQILAIPLDPVSGYANAVINAGLINSRGMELKLSAKPVTKKNFSWNTTLLWSRNRSFVRELASGITNQVIYAHNTNVTIEARVGGLMGDMYGRGFQRSPDGQIVYSSVGLPAALDPETKKWGNAFADWKGSLSNEFTIKNVRVSILLDGQKGGSMFSQTNHKNNTLGKTKVTLPGREDGIVGQGVVKQPDGTFTPNTVKVPASSYYDNYYQITNAETNIFDASFLKIREMRVEFNLPKALLGKIGVAHSSLAVYGRDLFNFTKFPGFDPEGGNLNNGTLTPGVELAQFPSTRTMGMNLTLKF
ncbi:SusC/RagA family TonB-linked outer membrane protein [Dyadobacter frigoris]|uniref:SusC/RagA family TonB-linked outer membrane protein n=1 Tax=Dyadobacter frigoris TaxID=2576211 RepID=UPI002552CB7E|nr:SusC/RagA family TonB-linked outer membrane protein [Dyadobacter frigoris]